MQAPVWSRSRGWPPFSRQRRALRGQAAALAPAGVLPMLRAMLRIHTLDLHFQDTPGLIAAFLLESGGELALVETGPGSTLLRLQQEIAARGFQVQDVRKVLITHIHLDHAGAAGWWAAQGAQVFCHPNAERHLTDPSRLLESARMVYGARMDALWGTILPAPAERVKVLQDGDSVMVGEVRLTAWDTPGHARHHHAFVCEDVCFTGDVAGMRLEGSGYLSVTAAPPQFDPAAYAASIDRLMAADFRELYLTHFGMVTDVAAHLATYQQRVQQVHEQVKTWMGAGADAAEVGRLYAETEHALALRSGLTENLWQRYEMGNNTAMCAEGVRLCVEKGGT